MAPDSRTGIDSEKAASAAPGRVLAQPDDVAGKAAFPMELESDFAELAAKFSAHAAGNFSAELSSDLALEIVLNEIVEGACLAMGATGAAIVLERDGEMSCRASSGETAPELGARLNPEAGMSGECVRTRQLQRCDDAQADPRVDAEASRRLGVRSVMIMPLLRDDELLGVFEVFSSRPGAFGERDEHTLEALSQCALKNLQRASEPLPEPAEGASTPVLPSDDVPAKTLTTAPSVDLLLQAEHDGLSGRRYDLVSWASGLTVLAFGVLFGVLVGRYFALQTPARSHPPSALARTAQTTQGGTPGESNLAEKPAPPASATSTGGEKHPPATRPHRPGRAAAPDSVAPEGGLRVYENGKEVFRLPSAQVQAELPVKGQGSELARASSIEPEPAMELTPAAAEDSLLYRVEPDYPEAARQAQIQGAVVLDVHIGPGGGVQEVTVVSGHPLLAQAATDAVKQWRFKPHQVEGHAVEMQTRITLNFRLPQ